MTWILGYASPFGYAVSLSDIRVTFRNSDVPTELDCVQKVHAVGPFVALGFSGSVKIGFAQVERLRRELSPMQPGVAWIPDVIAEWLPEVFREVFSEAPIHEMENRCDLMILAAHPTHHLGNPAWPECFVYLFKSPYFEAEIVPGLRLVSIGSGNGLEAHRILVQSFLDQPFDLIKMETSGSGMGSQILDYVVTDTLKKNNSKGISPHLHICFVRRGSITFGRNDHATYHPDGSRIEFRMPDVATTYDEYRRLIESRGLVPGAGIS